MRSRRALPGFRRPLSQGSDTPAAPAFGALTLAGADGRSLPWGATAITGGTATGYAVSGGFVVPSADGSQTAGTIIFDNGAIWKASIEANAYYVKSSAEITAAIAAISAGQDRIIAGQGGLYAGITISKVMSGVLSGVPVTAHAPSERKQAWNPTYSGGSIRIRSQDYAGNPMVFSGGVGFGSGTRAIIFDRVIIGRLATSAQYSYEPENGEQATITGITRGNPTVVAVSGAYLAKLRVNAKVEITDIVGTTDMNNVDLTILATSIVGASGTITLNYDSSGSAAWVSGGSIFGAGLTATAIAFTPGAATEILCRDMQFSNSALSSDAAYWSDLIGQGACKELTLFNVAFDGFQNAFKWGQGYNLRARNVKMINAIADNIPLRTTLASTAKLYAPTKTVTGITKANPMVITLSAAHGLKIGDSFALASVAGMTEANNAGSGTGSPPAAWFVYGVPSATTIQVGRQNTSYPEAISAVDSTAYTTYTSGGTLYGPLFSNVWFENFYIGPQRSDARFTAPHSDGMQMGSPINEVDFMVHIYDGVLAPITNATAFNATQGFFGNGGEVDSTMAVGEIKNLLCSASSPNQFVIPRGAPYRLDVAFIGTDRMPGLNFPADPGQENIGINEANQNLVHSCIFCGVSAGPSTAFELSTRSNLRLSTSLTESRVPIYAGLFTNDWRPDYLTYPNYKPFGLPSTGDLDTIMAAYAAMYKGVGAEAGRGFGGDPNGIWFTGTLDTTAVSITGTSVAKTAATATQSWSVNKAKGFAFWVVSATTGLSAAQVIDLAKTGGGLARGVIGLAATGAQGAIAAGGLTASTGYSFYVAISDWHGNTGVAETAFTTDALTKPVVQQNINGFNSTATASQQESASITIGSAANRVLVALVAVSCPNNATDISGTTFTFGTAGRAFGTGTAMTIIGSKWADGISPAKRARLFIAALAAPASGAGTVQVEFKNATPSLNNVGSTTIDLVELSNADQTLANCVFASDGGTGITTLTSSLTVPANDSLLLSIASLLGGSGTATGEAASGGATLVRRSNTGNASFSDHAGIVMTEEVPASGANGHGVTWTGAVDAAFGTISVAKA